MRWTLARKILCLALLNLSLLGAALLVFARSQFQLGPESLLLGPARERIVGIADSFTLGLDSTPADQRAAMFASYAKRYGADLFLTDPQGHSIVGPSIELSRELLDRISAVAPPPRRDGPLPRDGAPPPKKGGRGRRGEDGPPQDGPPRDEEPGRPPGPEDERGAGRPDEYGSRPQRPQEESGAPPQRAGSPPNAAFLVITHNPTGYWAGARVPVRLAEWNNPRPGILLLRSASMFNSNLFFDWRLWMAAALTVIGLTALCWLPFVHGITRSVSQMDRVTQQIAEGRFTVHAPVSRGDELGHLAEQINRMAARLEGFVKNQKRFLGDIAHELCAPLARIQFALGILEQKTETANHAHVATLHDEIQEMSALVNELLSFSKAGMNPDAAPLEAVDLDGVVQRAIARESFPGAAIESRVPAGLAVKANEAYLLRAVCNILRNAVRYAGAAGPIEISAQRHDGQIWLVVADHGPGLPESELDEIFEPFHRPEAARTRESGGAGLGLAIVKSCVEACQGTVECGNRAPNGLAVTIRLPTA
jgi:two-component system sensor histidine kinase CpxA